MNDITEKLQEEEVDRIFRVKPGERILVVVDESEEVDEDEDDEEVDEDEVADEDDDEDEEEEDELLASNVPSEIPEDVLKAELERRQRPPQSDR